MGNSRRCFPEFRNVFIGSHSLSYTVDQQGNAPFDLTCLQNRCASLDAHQPILAARGGFYTPITARIGGILELRRSRDGCEGRSLTYIAALTGRVLNLEDLAVLWGWVIPTINHFPYTLSGLTRSNNDCLLLSRCNSIKTC